jgi:alpha/beta superfamily hydrolase
MQRFLIDGPVGALEAQYTAAPASGDAESIAILCHPHPQYGGSMDDAVLDHVESVLLSRGVGCLRFNFRGVGESAGTFDHGNGETFDLLAIARWARDNKGARRDGALWLVGYSFGSQVAWRAAPEIENLRRLWLVAPPIGQMGYPAQPSLAVPVDVFLGTEDQFADQLTLDAWQRSAAPDVRLHRIDGGDHFFSGAGRSLAAALAQAAAR